MEYRENRSNNWSPRLKRPVLQAPEVETLYGQPPPGDIPD